MLAEQPPQLPLADAEPLGQGLDVAVVERAGLDQRQRARDGVRRAAPGAEFGRGFRPAAQAGPEAGLLRRRRGEDRSVTFSRFGVRAGQIGRQ